MQGTGYGLKVTVPLPYGAAVAKITEALKAQGFGVSSVIATMAPRALSIVGDSPELAAVAIDADARLRAALKAVEQTVAAAH